MERLLGDTESQANLHSQDIISAWFREYETEQHSKRECEPWVKGKKINKKKSSGAD